MRRSGRLSASGSAGKRVRDDGGVWEVLDDEALAGVGGSALIQPPTVRLTPSDSGAKIDLTLDSEDESSSAAAEAIAGAQQSPWRCGDLVSTAFGCGTIQAIHHAGSRYQSPRPPARSVALASALAASPSPPSRVEFVLRRGVDLSLWSLRATGAGIKVETNFRKPREPAVIDLEATSSSSSSSSFSTSSPGELWHGDVVTGVAGTAFLGIADARAGVRRLRGLDLLFKDKSGVGDKAAQPEPDAELLVEVERHLSGAGSSHGQHQSQQQEQHQHQQSEAAPLRESTVYEVWLQWGPGGIPDKQPKVGDTDEGFDHCWMPRAYFQASDLRLAGSQHAFAFTVERPFGGYSARTNQIMINADDLCRAWPGMHLNDTVIDFWIAKLVLMIRPQLLDRIYIFHSLFFNWLSNSVQRLGSKQAYLAVASSTKAVDIFSKDILFMPVNEGMHWTLAVICNPGLLLEAVQRTEEARLNAQAAAYANAGGKRPLGSRSTSASSNTSSSTLGDGGGHTSRGIDGDGGPARRDRGRDSDDAWEPSEMEGSTGKRHARLWRGRGSGGQGRCLDQDESEVLVVAAQELSAQAGRRGLKRKAGGDPVARRSERANGGGGDREHALEVEDVAPITPPCVAGALADASVQEGKVTAVSAPVPPAALARNPALAPGSDLPSGPVASMSSLARDSAEVALIVAELVTRVFEPPLAGSGFTRYKKEAPTLACSDGEVAEVVREIVSRVAAEQQPVLAGSASPQGSTARASEQGQNDCGEWAGVAVAARQDSEAVAPGSISAAEVETASELDSCEVSPLVTSPQAKVIESAESAEAAAVVCEAASLAKDAWQDESLALALQLEEEDKAGLRRAPEPRRTRKQGQAMAAAAAAVAITRSVPSTAALTVDDSTSDHVSARKRPRRGVSAGPTGATPTVAGAAGDEADVDARESTDARAARSRPRRSLAAVAAATPAPKPTPKPEPGEAESSSEGPVAGPLVIFLDSLRGGDRSAKVLRVLRSYLEEEWRARKGSAGLGELNVSARAVVGFSPEVPDQRNSCDCGVFMLEFFERLAIADLDRFLHFCDKVRGGMDYPAARKTFKELVGGPKWFTQRDVAVKRLDISLAMHSLAAHSRQAKAAPPP